MRAASYICILLPLVLMGCDKESEPVVTVVEAAPVELPAECTAPDPKWQGLPDGDVTRSQAVKQHDTNKGNYNRILARRSVCRAAINASKG